MGNPVIFRIIWFVLSFFEIGLYYWLLSGILSDRKHKGRIDTAVKWGSIAVMSILLAHLQTRMFFSHIVFSLILAAMILFTWLMYRKQMLLLTGIASTYFSFTALLDFSFAFLEAVLIESDVNGIIYVTGINVEAIMIFACIGSRIIMLLIIRAARRSSVQKDIAEYRNILLIIGTVLTVMALEYQRLLEHGITYSTVDMGILKTVIRNSMITLLTMVAIVCAMGILLLKNKGIKKENEFLLIKEEMERQKYEELTAAIEMNRELVHDTKNHYLIISEYERTGEYEKMHQYIEEIKKDFIKINPQIYTGNRILDLVLSQKRMQAERRGIAYELQAMPLAKLPFEDREICTLFGNLLDNAIEACAKVNGAGRIRVKIEKQKNLIFIEIANTAEEVPVKRGKGFLTSKADKVGHGYGLKSVQRIVEAYEGVVSYEVKEKEFIVTLSFFDMGHQIGQ